MLPSRMGTADTFPRPPAAREKSPHRARSAGGRSPKISTEPGLSATPKGSPMDSEMSDGTPVSPELDALMLADLREWRALHGTGLRYITLTIDELDMFLRVAAERDALRREFCEMPDDHFAPVPVRSIPFTAEIPAEVRERTEPAMRTPGICSRCGRRLYYSVPSHAWVHSGAGPKGCVPRPTPKPIS